MAKTVATVVNVSANGCVPAVNSLDTEVFSSHIVLGLLCLEKYWGKREPGFYFQIQIL